MGADVEANDDIAVADYSASETRRLTAKDLVQNGLQLIDDNVILGQKIVTDSVTALQIAPDAITASELANNAVDTAAIQDAAVVNAKVATGTLTGNRLVADTITANEIAPNAITASELADNSVDTAAIQALAITDVKIADGIDGAKITDGTVTNVELAFGIDGAKLIADTVTATEIAPDAITSSELADLSVDTAAIQDSAVTDSKIADGINGAKITDDTITADEIAPNAVTSSELADSAVDTAAIQDSAVTNVKIAAGIDGTKLTDSTVGNAKIIDLDGAKLLANTVTAAEIGPDAITSSELADLSVDTAAIQDLAVTNSKIASGVDGAKIINDTITTSKINASSFDRGLDKSTGQIGITNNIGVGGVNGITWDQQGLITSGVPLVPADLPPATTTDIGGVSVPTDSGLTVTLAGVLDHENNIGVGLMSGITYDGHGHISAAVPLVGTDLPPATDIDLGGVIVVGPVLEVTGNGEISVGNSPVAPGDYPKVSVDQYGRVIAGLSLLQADVPALDASILTTGTIDAFRLADKSIPREKLADYAISYIQEGQPSSTAIHHIGCLWYQESTAQLRMWNGNSFMPVGFGRLSSDNLRFGGTIDADTGSVSYVTPAGITAGLTVGGALPVATDLLGGLYLVVDNAGAGIPIFDVAALPFDVGDWVLAVSEAIGWIRIDNAGSGGSGASYLDDLLDVTLTSPSDGDALVYDASTNQWINLSSSSVKTSFVEAIDGVRTSFEMLTTASSVNDIRLSVGGVIQEPGVDFSFASPKAISFSAPPPAGIGYWIIIEGVSNSGGGGGGGSTLPPGTGKEEYLGWNSSLSDWVAKSELDGGLF